MNAREIVELAESAISFGESVVLATVVRLDGSGYGRPGARLVLTQSGERVGYISGGCLEKDLCRRAWDVTSDGPSLIAFDTRGSSVDVSRYNTGCDGMVYVLCRRIETLDDPALMVLRQSCVDRSQLTVRTVYRTESADVPLGRMDFHERATSESSRSHSVQWRGCDGGLIEAFCETLMPPTRLLIFGAGDDAQPLHRITSELGWQNTVVGRRPELATTNRFPGADVLCDSAHQLAKRLDLASFDIVVLMSHDLDEDVVMIPHLLDASIPVVGILGPKRRLGRLVQQLAERGRHITNDEADRIRSPIGLDIGATDPSSIAVSIVAELIAIMNNRGGGSLHHRQSPINEPHAVRARPVKPTIFSAISETASTCGLLLAAGASSRMGQPKQLLKYRDRTFLDWTIEQMFFAGCGHIVIVAGQGAGFIQQQCESFTRPDVSAIVNHDWASGQASSLLKGLREIANYDMNRILITLCDQPQLTADHYRQLINGVGLHHSIAATLYADGGGVPACIHSDHRQELCHAIGGDRGARDWLRCQPAAEIKLIHAHEAVNDIDTMADYERIVRQQPTCTNACTT